MAPLCLYGHFNSSAAYRVRIALALKNLAWESVPVDLRSGSQLGAGYAAVNAAHLVPTLVHGERIVTQSLAIIDYLDQIAPLPRLVPESGPQRTRALEIVGLIACDIHPVNNLRVLKYLTGELRIAASDKDRWYAHWISAGFDALEGLLAPDADTWSLGGAASGDGASIADCCLVPQVANALRCHVDLQPWPRICRINAYCCAQPAFQEAAPRRQVDYIGP
jgi:maleylacetoacetate isomerase